MSVMQHDWLAIMSGTVSVVSCGEPRDFDLGRPAATSSQAIFATDGTRRYDKRAAPAVQEVISLKEDIDPADVWIAQGHACLERDAHKQECLLMDVESGIRALCQRMTIAAPCGTAFSGTGR